MDGKLRPQLIGTPSALDWNTPAAGWKLLPAKPLYCNDIAIAKAFNLLYRLCLLKNHYRHHQSPSKGDNEMQKPIKTQMIATVPDAVDLIRFEKNLLQIGFFGSHEKRGKRNISTRKVDQWVNRGGKKIQVSAEFRCSESLGLPSTSDRDKYMAFMKLAMDQRARTGMVMNPIRFSGHRLLNILGLSDSGENYEAINSWGKRMADTTITSEQTIYSAARKKYVSKTIHVFSSFTRLGESNLDDTGKTDLFEVELENWLLENLNESYVVPEDFNSYRRLVRPTAKGIFVYLYLWFYASKGQPIEKDYEELCALLNIRSYEHVSKIKDTMGHSLDDLVGIGYLNSWEIKPMVSKNGYKLVLAQGRALKDVLTLTSRRQLTLPVPPSEQPMTSAMQEARSAMVDMGVSDSKAVELVKRLDTASILDRVDYVRAQIAGSRQGSFRNPAGYLISFVEGEQSVPKTHRTRQQREDHYKARKREDEEKEKESEASVIKHDYDEWCLVEAGKVIDKFTPSDLQQRLKAISGELRKKPGMVEMLGRMRADAYKEQLMSILRREVRRELELPCLEDWKLSESQTELFA